MDNKGIIFFDTETTGVPRNYNAPASDVDNWPRLVQIGWIVFDEGTYVGHKEYIIKPDGFTIPEDVSKVHGITQERALAEGVNLKDVLTEFEQQWLNPSDLIVGHNISFDINVVGAEFHRMFGRNPLENKPFICTMKSGTNFCQLPGAYGRYKWPKLHELYFKLFGREMGAAHTALQDIKNTSDCYFAMVERGIIQK